MKKEKRMQIQIPQKMILIFLALFLFLFPVVSYIPSTKPKAIFLVIILLLAATYYLYFFAVNAFSGIFRGRCFIFTGDKVSTREIHGMLAVLVGVGYLVI